VASHLQGIAKLQSCGDAKLSLLWLQEYNFVDNMSFRSKMEAISFAECTNIICRSMKSISSTADVRQSIVWPISIFEKYKNYMSKTYIRSTSQNYIYILGTRVKRIPRPNILKQEDTVPIGLLEQTHSEEIGRIRTNAEVEMIQKPIPARVRVQTGSSSSEISQVL